MGGKAAMAATHSSLLLWSRIASLKRDFGWRKSRYHGLDGMQRWLGLGIMASNLRSIALVK
jgi:hypothetical protein